jgi:hypothetical protein
MTLWEGARRLPYFFSCEEEGQPAWVVCPQCALQYVGDDRLTPIYTASRSFMCARCGILVGPINEEEAEGE